MKQLILFFLILPISCLGSGFLGGKTRVDREELTQLKEQINGLIELQTASGHIVKDVPRSNIPIGPDGKPYWPVVKNESNENIDRTKTGLSLLGPIGVGLGTLIGAIGGISGMADRKKKQAAIDKEQKTGEELTAVEKLLTIASIGVEIATTSGEIKAEIKKGMTRKQQDHFDELTNEPRIAAARSAGV